MPNHDAPSGVTGPPTVETMRPPDQSSSISSADLDRAVRSGIITAAQREQLETLAAGHVPERAAAGRSHERAPLVLVAYTAGALAVLFAFGWFLVERWRVLGPEGVLAVVLVYAAIFAATSWWLARHQFPLAAAFAALLAVGMTPVATWAVLRLTGYWQGPPDADRPGAPPFAAWSTISRWAIIELTTALAALVTYRSVRFAPLALPVAIAGWLAPLHIGAVFVDPLIADSMFGWGSLVTGSALLLVAYFMERGTRREHARTRGGLAFDTAGWVYRVFLVAYFFGLTAAWNDSAIIRHGLLVLAALGVTLALSLGRRELLAASVVAFISYLGYLAFDLFERVLSFPVVLASFGIALILLTVAVQRRWPSLSARLSSARAGERRLPGDYAIPVALLVTTVALLTLAPPKATERLWREHREQLKAIRDEGARRRQAGGVHPRRRQAETVPPRRP